MTAPTLLLNGEALPPSSDGSFNEDFDGDDPTSRSDETKPHNIALAWVWGKRSPKDGAWRHTLGILCLMTTVLLWTASNFLASTIFADDTYSKPYLITYINTSFFIIPLLPIGLAHLYREPNRLHSIKSIFSTTPYTPLLLHDGSSAASSLDHLSASPPLSLAQTNRLAFSFCFLWFTANYFVSACLLHTSVGTSTILTSTSSVWTLFFASLLRTERFTPRKLLACLACLTGVALTAGVDLSGESDAHRGNFPQKSPGELAVGNCMALLSAVLYGAYAVLMKKRLGDERRVNMVVFFGLVGMWNVLLLWPGLFILDWTGLERWQTPPTPRVTGIVLMNACVSLVSDICWGLSMLLTSPLLVTIGLSLTIPLSLVGQMFLNAQSSSLLYWLGAVIVLLSFIFINHEERKEPAYIEPTTIAQPERGDTDEP